ncbi:MAG: hypothetical protein JO048_04975 [Methylobacteriaceae bacterium]|nr:hypothetical protein [Methylobacteriaceae bacterium]
MKRTAGGRRGAVVAQSDPGLGELGSALLEALDLRVEVVRTASDAIDRLRDGAGFIDLMLSGVELEGTPDGYGLARRVSVLWPTVSLILTAPRNQHPRGPLPGGAVVIQKPWLPLDLVAAAERAARADHTVRAVRY